MTTGDLYHDFPKVFDESIINYGNPAQRLVDRAYFFEMPGTINGTEGVYLIGINTDGIIFHHNFFENK